MAVAIHFTPPSMTTAQYDEIIRRLEAAGAGQPPGREYHVCFGPDDKLEVVDVWTSVAQFEKFAETLFPILQSLNVEPGEPRIQPAHNAILPGVAATP